jgi:hypothetical protein
MELRITTSIIGVMALASLDGLLVKAFVVDFIL